MKVTRPHSLPLLVLVTTFVAIAVGGVGRLTAQPSPIEITSVVGDALDGDIKIKIKEPTTVSQDRLTFQPGAATPWHYHLGPAVVVVGTGAITEQDADGCVRVFPAGSASAALHSCERHPP